MVVWEDIQVLLVEPKLTSVAGNEIMVPDYGGVGSLSYIFMFLFVWSIDSLQQHLQIFAEMQV